MNGEDWLPFTSCSKNKMLDGDEIGLQVLGDVSSETDIPKTGGCRGRGILGLGGRGGKEKPLTPTKSLL